MVMYNNRFFATREEAKAFQKKHGGVLIAKPKRKCQRTWDWNAECLLAWDARRERIDSDKTPFCVAWNEVV